MSDYASVAEEARRAFASVAKLEAASMREPDSKALRMNLAAKQKLAGQLRTRLLEAAEEFQVEVCNYRLVQVDSRRYGLAYVSDSLLSYQYLFTQIHDAQKNGPKGRATFGTEALEESMLEVGYTYSGSLGVVLMAPCRRDLFREGTLDKSIDALFRVIDMARTPDVRAVARDLGNAVVKRIHDWSAANVKGGFDADVRWTRSDGRQLGQLVDRGRMERLVGLIEATSDMSHTTLPVVGALVGIDMKAGTFHLVVPNGEGYRGTLSPSFARDREVLVNRSYAASILETRTTIYATDQTKREHVLLTLDGPFAPSFQPVEREQL